MINSGYLFRQSDKKTPNHPDFSGGISLKEGDYYLSAWINTSKGGKKYLSIKIGNKKEEKPKETQSELNMPTEQQRTTLTDEDIPF